MLKDDMLSRWRESRARRSFETRCWHLFFVHCWGFLYEVLFSKCLILSFVNKGFGKSGSGLGSRSRSGSGQGSGSELISLRALLLGCSFIKLWYNHGCKKLTLGEKHCNCFFGLG
jgi:hypothetical protein